MGGWYQAKYHKRTASDPPTHGCISRYGHYSIIIVKIYHRNTTLYLMHNPKSLGVEPSQVEITGFEAGSLVVKAKINGLRDHHHAKEITGHVETKTKLASLLHKVGVCEKGRGERQG